MIGLFNDQRLLVVVKPYTIWCYLRYEHICVFDFHCGIPFFNA